MKFTLEPTADRNVIRSYSDSEVRVGERALQSPFIVTPHELYTDWPATSVSALRADDLERVLEWQPEVLLIGGAGGPGALSGEVRRALAARGIGCEVMHLGAACRTYNVLVSEQRAVAAALFPLRAT